VTWETGVTYDNFKQFKQIEKLQEYFLIHIYLFIYINIPADDFIRVGSKIEIGERQ